MPKFIVCCLRRQIQFFLRPEINLFLIHIFVFYTVKHCLDPMAINSIRILYLEWCLMGRALIYDTFNFSCQYSTFLNLCPGLTLELHWSYDLCLTSCAYIWGRLYLEENFHSSLNLNSLIALYQRASIFVCSSIYSTDGAY